jgi:hypothetical protein
MQSAAHQRQEEKSQNKHYCYQLLKARSKIIVILRVLFLSLFPAPRQK